MASYKVQDKTSTATAATTISIVWTNNTTAGNSIVVVVGTASATTGSVTSITDSQSNSYTQVFTNEIVGNIGDVEVWTAKNILGGATPTITVNLNGIQTGGAIAREYYGLDTVTLLNLSDGAATGTSTTPTSNALKTTQTPQILLGVMGTSLTGTISLGGSYQNLASVSNGIQVALEDLYVMSTGSYTAAFNETNSVAWECGIVALNESPHGTTTSTSSTSSTSSSTSISSTSISSTSSSTSSTSTSLSTSSTSVSISVTTFSTSSTSSSISSTSTSSTSSSTSVSSTSSSISSTSMSSTSISSTSSSTSISSTSSSISSTSSSISSTSSSTSSTSFSSTSSSSSTSTTLPPQTWNFTYEDRARFSQTQSFYKTGTWVCPANVTSVQAECWGGGGSGGADDNASGCGGGGGGGAYSKTTSVTVTSGTSYTVTVGGGGASVAVKTTGLNGGDSWFSTTGVAPTSTAEGALAKAGSGGAHASGGATAAGGAGGAKASGIGNVTHSGGTGGSDPNDTNGGGGGGAGGDSNDGGTGGAAAGGAGAGGVMGATIGGFGGAGGGSGDGVTGKAIGGAGGGVGGSSLSGNSGPGSGGAVLLTYVTTTPPPSSTTNLIDPYTNPLYADVAIDDGDYFVEYGSEYVMQEYKFKNPHNNNTDNIMFTWKGRSTEDPRVTPILMQIYNQNSSTWETIATINTIPADTDFSTIVTKSTNLSNYYDSSNIVSFRSYQLVI